MPTLSQMQKFGHIELIDTSTDGIHVTGSCASIRKCSVIFWGFIAGRGGHIQTANTPVLKHEGMNVVIGLDLVWGLVTEFAIRPPPRRTHVYGTSSGAPYAH